MGTEAEAIAAVDRPASLESLTADLRALGVGRGDIVVVHSSLSSLGWVAGGAQAVVEALLTTVGPDGTIVMPTQSGQLSDPAEWSAPPVPTAWIDGVRSSLPGYDPHLTPSRGMGAIVEVFRALPGTRRSPHPLLSLAANGPAAVAIVGEHPCEQQLGESSPLGRLYELGARVLLLGVDHGSNTSLHLAEYRADWPGKPTTTVGAPIRVGDATEWVTWTDLDIDEDDFGEIGAAFAATGAETVGPVGAATARLMSQRAVVDFAVGWMNEHRGR